MEPETLLECIPIKSRVSIETWFSYWFENVPVKKFDRVWSWKFECFEILFGIVPMIFNLLMSIIFKSFIWDNSLGSVPVKVYAVVLFSKIHWIDKRNAFSQQIRDNSYETNMKGRYIEWTSIAKITYLYVVA